MEMWGNGSAGETMMTNDRRTAAGKNGRYNAENDGSSSGNGLASAPNRQWPCDCDVTRDDSSESAATDNSSGFNRGNGTTGKTMTMIWLWPQMAIMTAREQQCDDDTTMRTGDDRGLQLQNNMHNDKGHRICVRIHTLGSIRWPRRRMGANQVQM